MVLINYFCQLFQNSTELFAFSTKLILLFVSFLFLPLHQISIVDNMRQFSLHITHSYSDVLLLSRFSLRSIIYDLSHHDRNTLYHLSVIAAEEHLITTSPVVTTLEFQSI